MLGDTSQTDPMRYTGDYGKGVYIYHTTNNLNYTSNVDVECADGLWNWVTDGTQTPDWSPTQNISLIRRNILPNPVLNDACPDFGNSYYMNNADGVSVRNGEACWFSWGKRHNNVGEVGTDKIYTNTPGWWTSREKYGDRFDAWNLGYNEIFSPYSNPNTNDASNSNTGSGGYGTGIFIYYHSLAGNEASFSIYKATNQTELNSILAATPPSKPMLYDLQEQSDGLNCHPKIIWRQNTEPDMIRNTAGEKDESPNFVKRYKIYRSTAPNMGVIPPDQQFFPEQKYSLVATVDINSNLTDGSWVDNTVNIYSCSYHTINSGQYPVRYRVQAVDIYNYSSVLSDFRSVKATTEEQGGDAMAGNQNGQERPGPQNPETIIPKDFKLYQNYPNPFNPVTNIQYDLPKDNIVTIKIYDILGKQVTELINEFKPAGSYLISFDGSKLGSGIYFYKIETKDFVQTKRMLLVK